MHHLPDSTGLLLRGSPWQQLGHQQQTHKSTEDRQVGGTSRWGGHRAPMHAMLAMGKKRSCSRATPATFSSLSLMTTTDWQELSSSHVRNRAINLP